MRYFMPFLIVSFVIGFSMMPPAFAQDDDAFFDLDGGMSMTQNKASGSGLSVHEYNDIPEGMMLDPEERDAKIAADVKANNLTITTTTSKMSFDKALQLYQEGKYDAVVEDIQSLASNGHIGAMELLGIMYRMGQGVKKNPAEAVRLLETAAMEGRPLSEHHLGTMFFLGEGVDQDKVTGLMWLYIAAAKYPDGPEKDQAIKDRDAISSQLSRRERMNAIQLAREWLTDRGEGHLLDMQ